MSFGVDYESVRYFDGFRDQACVKYDGRVGRIGKEAVKEEEEEGDEPAMTSLSVSLAS